MSIKVMTWVWSHAQASGNDLLVLLAIADCANDEGTDAWPSTATLAAKTRLDARTVQRRIAAMESAGRLRVDRREGRSNVYSVVMADTPDPRQIATPDPVDNPPETVDNTPGNLPEGGGDLPPHPRHSSVTPPPSQLRHPNVLNVLELSKELPPTPHASGAGGAGCPAHPTPAPNCRHCGTSPRAAARMARLANSTRPATVGTWCGRCAGPDLHRRLVLDGQGNLTRTPCPDCHPDGRPTR